MADCNQVLHSAPVFLHLRKTVSRWGPSHVVNRFRPVPIRFFHLHTTHVLISSPCSPPSPPAPLRKPLEPHPTHQRPQRHAALFFIQAFGFSVPREDQARYNIPVPRLPPVKFFVSPPSPLIPSNCHPSRLCSAPFKRPTRNRKRYEETL